MKRTLACACLLLCLLLSPRVWSQQTQVTGKVNGNDGSPIVGASVTVKGTPRGTTTDVNGQFSLAASNGETIVIGSVGYANVEFAVGQVPALITLSARAADLDDIVVIGY